MFTDGPGDILIGSVASFVAELYDIFAKGPSHMGCLVVPGVVDSVQ